LAAATVLALLGSAGLLQLPLDGPRLSDDHAWIAELTDADRLADLGYEGTGVTLCLVDSGIDLLHPDLARADLVAWNDLVNREPLPYDDSGHGTAMAGLIVGQGNVRGLAPGVALMVAKALRADGTGSSDTIGRAIRYCMDPDGDGNPQDGADIISLSLGAQKTPFVTNAAAVAARNATQSGLFVVSSAGNDGRQDDGDVGTPANEPLVFAVGAVDRDLAIAPFSSQGNNSPLQTPARVDPHRKPEFALPGVGLFTTTGGASYTTMTGTSASAALLSGLLALLLEAHPEVRKAGPAAVLATKAALMQSAMPYPGQLRPHDDRYGYGMAQAYEAHLLLSPGG
ncbi:MAG: S8 family serine peptidase, partial [Thermoplasmata archaeon]|nr:S8 family serine peptidase [Thermoplasmata archaeon]